MQIVLRSALVAAVMLAPAAAFSQYVIAEPPMLPTEIAVGPVDADGAAAIAMMHGLVVIEDVDRRWWDGNFEVDGTDATGNDIEITVDAATGVVLDIDD